VCVIQLLRRNVLVGGEPHNIHMECSEFRVVKHIPGDVPHARGQMKFLHNSA